MKFLVIATVWIIFNCSVLSQRTALDETFEYIYRSIRTQVALMMEKIESKKEVFKENLLLNKLQPQFNESVPFFCDPKGPGRRSENPPNSVHELRPGDIDIIAAMGDSLAAANGAVSTSLLEVLVQNEGMSSLIGGQLTWRQILTLPNILKVYNPNLYGYVEVDSISTRKSSKFCIAEPGAMSRDMPHQARILIKRMRANENVKMNDHWKLISILIGPNDFCHSIMCEDESLEVVIQRHERDLIETLRLLRDNIPRLMVNILPPPKLKFLKEFKEKPTICIMSHAIECPCVARFRFKDYKEELSQDKALGMWYAKDIEVVNREEFQNLQNFTVNIQPFIRNIIFPKTASGVIDVTYFSSDCFHLSQKGNARAANAVWNNMLEIEGEKSENWGLEFENFKCPTDERPFLATRKNSKSKKIS